MSSKQHSGPMAKPGSQAAASQAAGSTALDGGITKDSFIPLLDGQPQSYQEWRKRVSIYHLKMKIQKRSTESILNIIGSLQGTAWRLVENYDLSKILVATTAPPRGGHGPRLGREDRRGAKW